MYSIHPTISHQLADAKVAELRRIAGHARPHRPTVSSRLRARWKT